MKKIMLIILAFALLFNVFSQISYKQNEQVVQKEFITIGYDFKRYIPNWVFEVHTPNSLQGSAKRLSNFYKDKSINDCISENIFIKSGYDKGHMAPAADFKFSNIAMVESFSMLNVAPQLPKFNRIYWAALEEHTRKIILFSDTTYIITGHIPKRYIGKIKNKVYIPKLFFKAIYAVKANKCICSIAYIMENLESKQDYTKCSHTIDYLEKQLDRDLFTNISDEKLENKIILQIKSSK